MVSIKELKVGHYVVHEGEVCEVRNASPEKIELKGLFSGKVYSLNCDSGEQIEETDVIRRCAHIISKKKKGVEIMDVNNFETINAEIDDALLGEADVGDQVTYIMFNNSAKILEIRKGF